LTADPRRRVIDDILTEARSRLVRLTPVAALAARREGAVLIDIRPQLNRETEGEIPGAVVVERNLLEWRLDPAGDARMPMASYDLHAVVVCNEGYASSLAAVALHELGVSRATDVIGGYRAWRTAELPTTEAAVPR
jgi:rhodanese-related sulfurtransferase